jgi:hypothetical protein
MLNAVGMVRIRQAAELLAIRDDTVLSPGMLAVAAIRPTNVVVAIPEP